MTKDEIKSIEEMVTYMVQESTDGPDEHRIHFKADLALRERMRVDEQQMRRMLAGYLHRIAAHLEA